MQHNCTSGINELDNEIKPDFPCSPNPKLCLVPDCISITDCSSKIALVIAHCLLLFCLLIFLHIYTDRDKVEEKVTKLD